MGRLDDYEIYTTNTGGNIFISVTNYGVSFSKASVECLDYPEYVHVFFNRRENNMAIKPCEKDDEARVFVKNRDADRAGFVRWNDKKLIRYMIELADLKIGAKGIRIRGEYFSDENVLIYTLKNYSQIRHKDQE